MDANNRMSGIIKRAMLTGRVFLESTRPAILLDKLEDLNKNAEYPKVISLSRQGDWQNIEMQSGQHRMAILKQLKPDAKDQWWLVTLYDEGKTLREFTVSKNRIVKTSKRSFETQ